MGPYRRRHFIVHPRMQLSVAAVAVFIGLLSAGMVMYIFDQFFTEARSILTSLDGDHPVRQYLEQQHGQLLMYVTITFILFATFNVVILIFFTNRIAGPAYRLRKSMEEMLRGELNNQVRLRKGDFFQESAELLDQIRERLKSK